MKIKMKIKAIISIVFVSVWLFSCNELEILKEIPKDFFAAENAYKTPGDIEMSITALYANIRRFHCVSRADVKLYSATDVMRGTRGEISHYGGQTIEILPTNDPGTWSLMYKCISNANTILNRMTDVPYDSEELKNVHIAEARFFRAYAYRTLACLYGGVPIELEEVKSPKRDYVRASREEVYKQCRTDLEFAVDYLPSIEQVKYEGRISKAAAFHLLSEICIALKDWDAAVDAASAVIDNPDFSLMTERFGNYKNVEGRDPFWDLFQLGNQDRSSGNKETIWALQTAFDIPGGSPIKHDRSVFQHERQFGPIYWMVNTPDGFVANKPLTSLGGRPGGYGAPTNYVKYTIWEGNWDNDTRNADYNIIRDWPVTNEKSVYYGKMYSDFPADYKLDTLTNFYPYFTKFTTINTHPDGVIMNKETGELWASAGGTHHDWYAMRLAETYLLRAEAYLGKNDKESAAADINTVRARSHAKPISAEDVTIDYILDERARELYGEEIRRVTLNRLGLLVERTRKYNEYSKTVIKDHYNLLPIPYSEIEANTLNKLDQNPGYIN